MSGAYYNEIDPFAAAWLRELIKAGWIADGDVDERSITDVRAGDLRGFIQCHFFAGVGVWSYALRCAGWDDTRPVWTGSCPCQPFSSAGKGAGAADPRHLWPAWFELVAECRPDVIFGEQTASVDGLAWLDLVHADLEGAGYAVGAADLCAAGIGAPHIRQRLYFVGALDHAECDGAERAARDKRRAKRAASGDGQDEGGGLVQAFDTGVTSFVADTVGEGRDWQRVLLRERGPHEDCAEATGRGEVGELANAGASGRRALQRADGAHGRAAVEPDGLGDAGELGHANVTRSQRRGVRLGDHSDQYTAWPTGAVGGFWRDADWIPCRDGKWRPVKPGTCPLVARTSCRVGRLRGYGNALCAPVAQAFIEAYLAASEPRPARQGCARTI